MHVRYCAPAILFGIAKMLLLPAVAGVQLTPEKSLHKIAPCRKTPWSSCTPKILLHSDKKTAYEHIAGCPLS